MPSHDGHSTNGHSPDPDILRTASAIAASPGPQERKRKRVILDYSADDTAGAAVSVEAPPVEAADTGALPDGVVQPLEAWVPGQASRVLLENHAEPPVEARPARSKPRTFRQLRGFILGLAAFGLAVLGTALLAPPELRTWGELLIVAAGVLGVAAWGGQRWLAAYAPGPVSGPVIVWGRGRVVRLGGLAVAGLLLWQANSQMLANRREVFGLAGWLWLASMALLVASTVRWPRRAEIAKVEQREAVTPEADAAGTAQPEVKKTLVVAAAGPFA